MVRPRILSEKKIVALTPARDGTRYEVPDGSVPNLFLRVGPKKKTYVLLARYAGADHSSRRKIGDFPKTPLEDARATARKWNKLIERGIDPTAEEKRTESEHTLWLRRKFRHALEDYLVYLPERPSNRHAEEDIQALRKNVLVAENEKILDKQLSDIVFSDIKCIVTAIRDRPAAGQARNVLALIKTFFSWASSSNYAEGYGLTHNVVAAIKFKDYDLSKVVRKLLLPTHHVRAYWNAAETTPYPYGPLLKLALLTGVQDRPRARALVGN
jgi:hypothetical protein